MKKLKITDKERKGMKGRRIAFGICVAVLGTAGIGTLLPESVGAYAESYVDENGNDVAYANSLWVYMDIERGRPARPDESEIAPYGTGEPYEMTYESRKIPLPTESEELESFPVRRYHIDTNEHVNNCQYVQMALESLPKDKEVHQMRVEYKKSAVYGDMIYPRIAAEDDRTVVELCDENAKPYAVIEFRFA